MSLAGTTLDAPGQAITLPTSAPAGGVAVDAAERGELTIAEQVVEKIAATALSEVEHVGGAARRVLGVALGPDGSDRLAQVHARVNGSLVTLEVTCSVAYPAPVGTVTEQARSRIIDRVEQLTGLGARQVDITVTTLTTTMASSPRELR
jgi:uncharacterized alkaline shock family protein YloU